MTLKNKKIKSFYYASNFEDVNLFAHLKVIYGHDRLYV